ncbi:hypothetical protein [Mucilaginibacter sp.]|jgi:hypothetical protein|uniref:hypothetical protein n=1 Tax=Mucilaginibacter sp. TaxID=1882438 RepID=UPI00356AC38E
MEEKIYQCDQELEALILKQGWIETTDAIDRKKGKKEFRKSKGGRMLMRFDYINFVVYENSVGINRLEGPRIAEGDLKLLFWYINSNPADKDYISDGHFDLDRTRQCAETMDSLLGYYREFNRSNRESKKFERLLNNLKSVNLN